MELLVKYFVFGVGLAISIGPVNLELIKRGMTRGFFAAWTVGIGGMTADITILFIVNLGLGNFFTSSIVRLVFGCLGSLMLLYIGFKNIRKATGNRSENIELRTPANTKENKPFMTGFLLAISNPLNLVFWSGICASIQTVNTNSGTNSLCLFAVIFIGISIANILFAWITSAARTRLKPSGFKFIALASGFVLSGYGLWIGYSTVISTLQIA